MNAVNERYWYEQWHLDFELHAKLGIKNITKISKSEPTSIYADTDSLFVSFEPAIEHCEWQNLVIDSINTIDEPFVFLEYRQESKIKNKNCLGHFRQVDDLRNLLQENQVDLVLIDGYFAKQRDFNSKELQDLLTGKTIRWNWDNELDFIHGIDQFRFGGYFKKMSRRICRILWC
jgi:hypothetical protein